MAPGKIKNILFILTDDQGAWAMGCSGNSELKTPNLDRLAGEGERFENFYCASPVCSPARASILTGKMPSSHGVHDWLAFGQISDSSLSADLREKFDMEDTPFDYRWPKSQLRGDKGIRYLDGHRTFTEVLRDRGYRCALSGKWHIGAADRPQAGFDNGWYTCAIGGADYYNAVVLENGEEVLKHGEYITDVITDKAIEFLDGFAGQDDPFCLCVHYTAPHSPWAKECHPKEYIEMYDGCPFDSVPHDPPHPWVRDVDMPFSEWKKKPHPGVRYIHANYAPIRETWEEYRNESLRGYYAAVTAMDAGVGRLVDRLDELGLSEDTLVVFTSDNGSNMGHHGIFGKGNGTYPLNMYATSVKVPGLFRCPGTVPAGRVIERNASHYDLFETILDITGTPYEKTPDMPGESFADLLKGDAPDGQGGDAFVCDEYGGTRMICDGRYKLVRRYPAGPDELFDLERDPGEYSNCICDPSYAEIVASLDARLEEWFRKYTNPAFDGRCEKVTGNGQITSHIFK